MDTSSIALMFQGALACGERVFLKEFLGWSEAKCKIELLGGDIHI